jgi:hypothetical protein
MNNGPQPEQFAKNGSEHGHQVALFVKFAQNFFKYPELRLAFAIPNGGMRDKITAANLKAEGVKAAVPDVFIPVARGKFHGLFVEMKRPEGPKGRAGAATPEQLKFIADLQAQGFGAVVCVGWEQAWTVVEQYLNYQ